MARGVKKIKMISTAHYAYSGGTATVKPDQELTFVVNEWLPASTEEDKKNDVFWLLQTNDRKTILHRVKGKEFQATFNKKLCGSYSYYLEASLSGNRDFKNSAGIYINGYTKPIIKKSEWRSEPKGSDIRKVPIAYGDVVYLWLETEGLSGDYISIEVYNNRSYFFDDTLVVQKKRIKVKEGEALYKIGDTNLWMAKVKNRNDNEEFFIKVKTSNGKYVIDNNGDAIHARFLRVKDKMSSNLVKPSENITPTKIFKAEVNAERFEPCKFNKLTLTIPEVKKGKLVNSPIPVFDNGKGLKGVKNTDEKINRSVHFQFNDYSIAPDAQKILNNILGFLLEHIGTTINMSGYACVIGKEGYNQKLSQKRGDAVKDFFVQGGLDGARINSTGKGEYNIKSADDYKKRNEEVYIDARRVDISFKFANHSANAIVIETIAPSSPKDTILDIEGFEVKDCYRNQNKHANKIIINSPDAEVYSGSGTSAVFPIQSTLTKYHPAPLQYIWPKYNIVEGIMGKRGDSAAVYNIHLHSCRYYSNKKYPAVKLKVYPDIKWTLKFFLNLTNDLGVTWKDQPASKHKELQKKAGKIGAENRWKQKDASFGFSLKSEWDTNNSGTYNRNEELKLEYEAKFKKLYDLFSSIGSMSQGITKKTGGQIRNIGFKGVPMKFEIKPPNLNIQGIWNLEKVNEKLGTKVDISFNAEPLIGLEMTVDLLCLAVGAVAGAFTGGTASQPAMRLYGELKGIMNTGVDVGTDDFGFKASADVYIDLVISSTIKTSVGFNFNTAGSVKKEDKAKLEVTNTLKIELKAGMWVKAEANLVIVKVEGYFEMSAKGSAAVTFGHGVNYNDQGLYYTPKLGFDGITAEYVVKGKVGLSSKKKILWGGTPSTDNEDIISQGKAVIVEPFDVIKSLEETFKFKAQIPLIKNT
ncbi:OmpA family protein [Aquimarina sp. I32.4]|uniref:OmpA family protein n=1 Tax=Aquimarina sp. I32.4 TaxID=2053903 RepID=UPI000CDEB928|nr:OmpA family protein [Aquimarina sp. I32.4]